MTSTQNHSQARIDAAIRYWRINQGGNLLGAEADGPDVVIVYGSGLNGSEMRYRVSRNDIDLLFAHEDRRRHTTERLRSHGLPAMAGGGGTVLSLNASQAERLADRLDEVDEAPLRPAPGARRPA